MSRVGVSPVGVEWANSAVVQARRSAEARARSVAEERQAALALADGADGAGRRSNA